jgi:hypothetical protein
MAQLSTKEFEELIQTLVNHLHFDRLHDKLLKANALVSRKRPANVQALAAQLYRLSAGLQRQHAARYAVEVLWQEMLSSQVTEEHTKTLETLADRVNTCLTTKLEVIPEKSADLISALGAYYQAVAALTNDEIAYLEVLLRASTDVAHFLRAHKEEITTAVASPPTPQTPTETAPEGQENQ